MPRKPTLGCTRVCTTAGRSLLLSPLCSPYTAGRTYNHEIPQYRFRRRQTDPITDSANHQTTVPSPPLPPPHSSRALPAATIKSRSIDQVSKRTRKANQAPINKDPLIVATFVASQHRYSSRPTPKKLPSQSQHIFFHHHTKVRIEMKIKPRKTQKAPVIPPSLGIFQ